MEGFSRDVSDGLVVDQMIAGGIQLSADDQITGEQSDERLSFHLKVLS